MAARRIIGLSAGPSLAGVDAALVYLEGQGLSLRPRQRFCLTEPYPRPLRDLLARVTSASPVDPRQLGLAHRLLGETLANAACMLADRASESLQNILCLGCGGLAAMHDGDGKPSFTLSLGASAVIAERTGLTTITDFAWRDLAAGGQGTPLGAIGDYLLFHSANEDRLVIHLGGLARVTFLPADADPRSLAAWETGPCNILLDGLIQQASGGREWLDAGGKHAVQGRLIPELLERWLKHPLLLRRPPRSTHRSVFAEEFARQTLAQAAKMGWGMHDLLCTANHFVVRTVLECAARTLPKPTALNRVILTGGGTRNGLLWKLLEEQLQGAAVERSDQHDLSADATSAIHAALLAALFLDGQPQSLPSATGAGGPRLLGSLTPGAAFNWARCAAWLAGRHDWPDADD